MGARAPSPPRTLRALLAGAAQRGMVRPRRLCGEEDAPSSWGRPGRPSELPHARPPFRKRPLLLQGAEPFGPPSALLAPVPSSAWRMGGGVHRVLHPVSAFVHSGCCQNDRLGGFPSHSSGGRTSKVRAPADSVSGEDAVLVHRRCLSPVSARGRGGGTNPLVGAPSSGPDRLPETPSPQCVTLGVRAQHSGPGDTGSQPAALSLLLARRHRPWHSTPRARGWVTCGSRGSRSYRC